MDQATTGKFIAAIRREKGLTQKELAERLSISDKTVSKWECGLGFPEVGLILPLCDELGITANELLSGKRLSEQEYKQNAEENIVKLIRDNKEIKRRLFLESFVVAITIVVAVALSIVASYVNMATAWRVTLLVAAMLVVALGCGVAIALERACGFQCSCCNARFMPTIGAYLIGMHTFTKRYLKCPKCGVRNWCRISVSNDVERQTVDDSENEKTDKK